MSKLMHVTIITCSSTKNDADKEKCDVCRANRYEEGGSNTVPRKVVLYHSITDRLRRQYMHEETANLMQYHARICEDQHGANGDKQSARLMVIFI